jgi:hypothetical protein
MGLGLCGEVGGGEAGGGQTADGKSGGVAGEDGRNAFPNDGMIVNEEHAVRRSVMNRPA